MRPAHFWTCGGSPADFRQDQKIINVFLWAAALTFIGCEPWEKHRLNTTSELIHFQLVLIRQRPGDSNQFLLWIPWPCGSFTLGGVLNVRADSSGNKGGCVVFVSACGFPSAASATWNTKASDSNQDKGERHENKHCCLELRLPGFCQTLRLNGPLMFCKCCTAKQRRLGARIHER